MHQEIKDKFLRFFNFCKENGIQMSSCGCCDGIEVFTDEAFIINANLFKETTFEQFIKYLQEVKNNG